MPDTLDHTNNRNRAYALAALEALADGADATPLIQEAVNAALGPVRLPSGTYYVDGTVVAEAYRGLDTTGVELIRRSGSTSTAPLVHLRGTQACLIGTGELFAYTATPDGLVLVGHKDATSNWNVDNCLVRDVSLRGTQVAGSVSSKLMSSQPWLGPTYSSYFHTIDNVKIRGADIGILFAEKANGCKVSNCNFWDCVTAAFSFEGAYSNMISNCFVHTCADGVIGLHLRNHGNRPFSGHHSWDNTIVNFSFEPGGTTSRSVVIESGCTHNRIWVMSNVNNPNGSITIGNHNNSVFNLEGKQIFAADSTLVHAGTSEGRDSIRFQGGGTMGEGVTVDLLTLTVIPGKAFLAVVDVSAGNATINKNAVGRLIFSVTNTGSGPVAVPIEPNLHGDGIGLAWSVAGNVAKLSIVAFSDAAAPVTTFAYTWTSLIQGTGGVPNAVKL